jgi:hypothetical protein
VQTNMQNLYHSHEEMLLVFLAIIDRNPSVTLMEINDFFSYEDKAIKVKIE